MKIFKNGFTLAEILITLSIIGIIAALLIPQLVDNTRKNQYGATLGKAVHQIELGISNMIQQANNNSTDGSIATTLDTITIGDIKGGNNTEIITDNFNLFQTGMPYIGLEAIEDASSYYSSSDTGFAQGNVALYKFDKFNAFVMYAVQRNSVVNDIYTVVAIDVNGNAKPNKKGRDIFAFGLTTKGKLVPAGTKKVQEYTAQTSSDLGSSVPLAEDGCKDGNITNGWSCTARVIQDGFKINY